MVDDVQSFVAAAEVLKERGAYKIYVLATHGLLSSDAPRLIEDSPIDEASFLYLFYAVLLQDIETVVNTGFGLEMLMASQERLCIIELRILVILKCRVLSL